jgi:hypothetical protein
LREAWEEFESSIDGEPFIISALINGCSFAETLIDTSCLSHKLYDPRFTRKNKLTRLKITPRQVINVDRKLTAVINEVIAVNLDLDSHKKEKVFLYMSLIGHYDMILSMP